MTRDLCIYIKFWWAGKNPREFVTLLVRLGAHCRFLCMPILIQFVTYCYIIVIVIVIVLNIYLSQRIGLDWQKTWQKTYLCVFRFTVYVVSCTPCHTLCNEFNFLTEVHHLIYLVFSWYGTPDKSTGLSWAIVLRTYVFINLNFAKLLSQEFFATV